MTLAAFAYIGNSDRISSIVHAQGHLLHRIARVQNRLAHDEHGSCKIQERGLKASHIQTRINRDLGLLLKVIPPATAHATRLQRFDRRVAIALGRNARAYFRIEHHQPKTRRCRTAAL